MPSKRTLTPNPPHRVSRKGLLFTAIRFAGRLFEIVGLLLLGIAVIGFFFMLVRIGQTFVGSIRSLDQQMAGFIFLVSLGYLLIFPIIGLVGVVTVGLGLAVHFVGTERQVELDDHIETVDDEPTPEQLPKNDG
jgi:hypothetical protein